MNQTEVEEPWRSYATFALLHFSRVYDNGNEGSIRMEHNHSCSQNSFVEVSPEIMAGFYRPLKPDETSLAVVRGKGYTGYTTQKGEEAADPICPLGTETQALNQRGCALIWPASDKVQLNGFGVGPLFHNI